MWLTFLYVCVVRLGPKFIIRVSFQVSGNLPLLQVLFLLCIIKYVAYRTIYLSRLAFFSLTMPTVTPWDITPLVVNVLVFPYFCRFV